MRRQTLAPCGKGIHCLASSALGQARTASLTFSTSSFAFKGFERTSRAPSARASPTAFWLVRVFDLGFSMPLGFVSLYLLWARPNRAYAVVCLFYGFFFTQIIAVNAMGWMMFLKHDPTFMARDLVVFSVLALIIFFGFFYVRRNYTVG